MSESSLYVVFLFLLVPTVVVGLLLFARQYDRGELEAPFTEPLLRPPGESVRRKLAALGERITIYTVLIVLLPAAAGILLAVLPTPPGLGVVLFTLVVVAGLSGYLAWRVMIDLRTAYNSELGFQGERAVAEELNRLLRDGFSVYHDVPLSGSNIDHVVVGPAGVFALETKTRRRHRDDGSDREEVVAFDGEQLLFPHTADSYGIDQAERHAGILGRWLEDVLAEGVPVRPVLVLPGWRVARTGKGGPDVVGAKEATLFFKAMPPDPQRFPERLRKQVDRVLEDRCRSVLV